MASCKNIETANDILAYSQCSDLDQRIAQALDDAEARVRREYEPLVAWAKRACRELEIHSYNLESDRKGCDEITDAGRVLLREREEVDGE